MPADIQIFCGSKYSLCYILYFICAHIHLLLYIRVYFHYARPLLLLYHYTRKICLRLQLELKRQKKFVPRAGNAFLLISTPKKSLYYYIETDRETDREIDNRKDRDRQRHAFH